MRPNRVCAGLWKRCSTSDATSSPGGSPTLRPNTGRWRNAWVVALIAGLLGLAFGSFLNVCSLRWPRDESVVAPRSRCPRCDILIAWHDNVPVLSWILLGGRCRECREPISVQYPLVELATGLMWAGVFWAYGPTWEALRGSLFLTIIFGIALSDARFYIIPDQCTGRSLTLYAPGS